MQQRNHSVIVRTISQFTSYPNGPNYGQFFKYKLVKYKPWFETASSLLNFEDEEEVDFVSLWNEYLTSELCKKIVPNW